MANTVSDERRRLHDRLVELDAERGHIAYALSVLDRIDAGKPPTVPNSAPQHRYREAGEPKRMRPGGSYERAVRIINSSGRGWRVDELVSAMRQEGWAAQVANEIETVRTALSRAVNDGVIIRPEQGLYAPKVSVTSDPIPNDAPQGDSPADGSGSDDSGERFPSTPASF